jgi:hypothetical protein
MPRAWSVQRCVLLLMLVQVVLAVLVLVTRLDFVPPAGFFTAFARSDKSHLTGGRLATAPPRAPVVAAFPAAWTDLQWRTYLADNLSNSTVSFPDIDRCRAGIEQALATWDKAQRAAGLTLVIYHLGNQSAALTSIASAAQVNNVKIFTSAASEAHPAFYVFNVLYGRKGNAFAHLLPSHAHACSVDWLATPYDVTAQMATAALLGHDVVRQFENVFMLNQGVRGPLTHRANGEWLQIYRSLLNSDPHVALAGPSISCGFSKHVQTFAWTISTRLLPLALAYELSVSAAEMRTSLAYVEHAEVGLSRFFRSLGFNIASLSDQALSGSAANVTCNDASKKVPSWYAKLGRPSSPQAIFFKFGGGVMNILCSVDRGTRRSYLRDSLLNVDVVSAHTRLLRAEADLVWPDELCT